MNKPIGFDNYIREIAQFSRHQFAADPNPDHNPNRACNPYKYYTGVC